MLRSSSNRRNVNNNWNQLVVLNRRILSCVVVCWLYGQIYSIAALFSLAIVVHHTRHSIRPRLFCTQDYCFKCDIENKHTTNTHSSHTGCGRKREACKQQIKSKTCFIDPFSR